MGTWFWLLKKLPYLVFLPVSIGQFRYFKIHLLPIDLRMRLGNKIQCLWGLFPWASCWSPYCLRLNFKIWKLVYFVSKTWSKTKKVERIFRVIHEVFKPTDIKTKESRSQRIVTVGLSSKTTPAKVKTLYSSGIKPLNYVTLHVFFSTEAV